nr:MAG TPA: protein of unknown function DUF2466 [Caudoviricetes sp.]
MKRGKKKLQQAHKDLLREVMNRGGIVEVARCYNMNMEPLSDYVSQDKNGRVKIPDFDTPYIAIHNHPSGLTFSPSDVYRIADREYMMMLTDVGNDGSVYSVEKKSDINAALIKNAASKAADDIGEEKSDTKALSLAVSLIKKCGEYGIEYYR